MRKKFFIIIAIFLPAFFAFFSCQNPGTENSADDPCCQSVSADSLIALWNDAWNTNDLDALKGMIADSAFVIDHDWSTRGKDSIFAKWINPSLTVIGNLQTTPLKTTSCCCCVSMTGLYSLDYTSKEGVSRAKGNFTYIWTLQQDKTYKLVLMHLTEFDKKEGK